jgi:hypothetical protein
VALAACVLVSGCALWSQPLVTGTARKPTLPAAVSSIQGIEFEAYFVDRPAGDPLAGEPLWRDIDQISGIRPEARALLNRAGMRFGVSGSSPPPTLRSLLSTLPQPRTQRFTLLSGQETELEANVLAGDHTIRVLNGTRDETRDYNAPRCVLRVKAHGTQEGWVRLEFLPELHSGALRVRPTANDREWRLRESQEVDPLYEHRFSVEVNVGEIVVIGGVGDEADSLGQHFFRNGETPPRTERVLILRVAAMNKVAPTSSPAL